MKLLKPLPNDRSYEQVKNHYLVEKALADKLKNSAREQRTEIFSTMYDELFSKVPDHPRLTIRSSKYLTNQSNKRKFTLFGKFLEPNSVVVEFAPGDCKFAKEASKKVQSYYGVDISEQSDKFDQMPDNFELIVYDGYNLQNIKDNSVDIVLSDQLIEHLHEEDAQTHLKLVHNILKPGGKYVFRTPHLLTGPHDVSQYFSYRAEGFHLKEWTFTEMKIALCDHGFSKFDTYWSAKGLSVKLPNFYFNVCESMLNKINKKHVRPLAKLLIPTLYGVAIK
jgi:SAM-dependent methyltransferase